MLPAERRARIVSALKDQRAVRVPALSEDLGVSEITIRRDLLLLEQEGVLDRTYGGAVIKKRLTSEPRWEEAVGVHSAEKDAIAAAAAEMIEPQDTVFFGSGTTVVNILRHVDPELEARVVTHSLAVASEARVIGTVGAEPAGLVTMRSSIGSTRIVDMLSGEQLPRIC